MPSTFDRALALMRKHDPQKQEAGFALLSPVAADFLPELVAAFEAETDHGLRCWLLELIGHSGSEEALPVLTRELASEDESLRTWAERGLRDLNTKAARTVLWSASRRTLDTYEAHVAEYLASTAPALPPVLVEWLDEVLAPYASARVLEIGSGPGQIAEHLIERGHRVDLTDATAAFVRHLRERGHPATMFDVLTDPVPSGYDVILANAVFLHLTRAQLASALGGLRSAERLAFTVKQGDGEEWSSAKLGAPRYFCYWQAEPLRAVVAAAGYTDVQITGWTSKSGQPWLAVHAAS